ncbi:MAG: sigma-70 family RNA polymerase sigma factor [Enhygromyxa sp.]
MHVALRERFLAALAPALVCAFADRRELEATLVTRLDRARAALELEIDLALWIESLAGALTKVEDFEGLPDADLYLARACGRGDPQALRRFAELYAVECDRAIARSPTLGLSRDEFRQLVSVHLFVREHERPARISGFCGRGSLRAWVRVVCARLIVDLSRRASPARDHELLLERLDDNHDPELAQLRRSLAPQLRDAFEVALAAVDVRQRNLLRQRYLHEVPVDALASLYGVHRSTVYLWLEQARAAVLDHARAALALTNPDERLDSLIRLLGSELELSLRRLLENDELDH